MSYYSPLIGPDEELHEITIEAFQCPAGMTLSDFIMERVAIKANKLGKEKRKVLRIESNTNKIDQYITVWFICEFDPF